jgi:hypothetical protein
MDKSTTIVYVGFIQKKKKGGSDGASQYGRRRRGQLDRRLCELPQPVEGFNVQQRPALVPQQARSSSEGSYSPQVLQSERLPLLNSC